MTAHGGEDEGLGLPCFKLVTKDFHELLIVGQAAAAGCDADAFSRQVFDGIFIEGLKLFL